MFAARGSITAWADFRGAFYFYIRAQSTKLDSSVMLLAYSSANLKKA
jgi:hypothetical protein